MLAQAGGGGYSFFSFFFSQRLVEGEGAQRTGSSQRGCPAHGLLPLCLAALPLGPFPVCQADSLLAVIYGRTWHRAHRLENFQFTQEFPEK